MNKIKLDEAESVPRLVDFLLLLQVTFYVIEQGCYHYLVSVKYLMKFDFAFRY